MRVVFVGSNKLSVMTARNLLEHGHEVIIIERDKQRIDEPSEKLDCGFLHGDGGRPAILQSVSLTLPPLAILFFKHERVFR